MSTAVLAQATTTTTEAVPRIVGDPLPTWVWFGSGVLLLVAILAAGWYVSRRTPRD